MAGKKGQWRAGKSYYDDLEPRFETSGNNIVNIHDDWASPHERFNERDLGSNLTTSRSLKFLKGDFPSAQVFSSRVEKLPVLNADADIYKNVNQRNLHDPRKRSPFSSPKVKSRQRDSNIGGHKGSSSNRSLSCGRKSSGSHRLSPPMDAVRCDYLPNLISIQELVMKRNASDYESDTGNVSSFNYLQRPVSGHAGKNLMSLQNFQRASQDSCKHSSGPLLGLDLTGNRRLSGSTLSSNVMVPIMEDRVADKIYMDTPYLISNDPLSVGPEEDRSCSVVWQSMPSPKAFVLRNAPTKIHLCSSATNTSVKSPNREGGRYETDSNSEMSSVDNRDVVWSCIPDMFPSHSAVPPIKELKSPKKNIPKFSYNVKSVNSPCKYDGNNEVLFSNQSSQIGSCANSTSECLSTSKGRSLYRASAASFRTSTTDKNPSNVLGRTLSDGLIPRSSLGSLHDVGVPGNAVRGHSDVATTQVILRERGRGGATGANEMQARMLIQTVAHAVRQCKSGKVSLTSGKLPESIAKLVGGISSQVEAHNTFSSTVEFDKPQRKAKTKRVSSSHKFDNDSAVSHKTHLETGSLENREPLSGTLVERKVDSEKRQVDFPFRIIKNRYALMNKRITFPKNHKRRKNKASQAAAKLLRAIYLDTPSMRRYCHPLPSRVYLPTTLAQLAQGCVQKNKSYPGHSSLPTSDKRKESIGKKAERVKSLLKSKDPFSYLLNLHGFWGEVNYY